LRATAVSLAGLLFACSGQGGPIHLYAGACQPLTARGDSNGQALEDAAIAFAQNLEAGNASAARAEMTTAAQNYTSEAQLTQLSQMIRQQGATGAPTVAAIFQLKFTVPPHQLAFVPCAAQSPHRGMDFVGADPDPEQGYVVLNTATANDSASVYSIALRRQDGAWRVGRFHFDPSVLGGRDASFWWAAAKKQAAEGHVLNAALLYGMAKTLLSRGPDYQPAGLADLLQEMTKVPAPAELRGKPPYALSLGGQTFPIATVGLIAIGRGDSLLLLVQQLPWNTDAEAVAFNHRLIDAFAKAHPEWADAFGALAARTCRPDNRCFGTVYDKGRGYEQQSTSPVAASTR
jgi:hypothetical protein